MLPQISQSQLNVKPIDWLGLPKRYLNEGEMEVLVALAQSVKAEVGLEIGCNTARTSKLLLHNVPTLQRMVGIDVLPGYRFAKAVQRNEIPTIPGQYAIDDERFELLLSKRGSFDLQPHELPMCQFVFVDGDHGRDAILHDAELAKSITRPGGVVVYHDYNDNGTVDVREVLNEMSEAGAKIQHVQGTWIAFERV